ncbi:hypothetical protein [Phenylobacterium sp.]|uniref:hypothetical protein n=1 Tax=Phenylobacterium sp. TaxID=1871053 RepID=UPI002B5A4D0E|nr:hypothetical protein [Phenylobacterium sp.]HLZ75638.1 hypothetical protein [Phenylobacterium sp.]
MTSADPRSRQLSEMAECAYRLGMAFGAATEKAQGTDGWLAYFNAFDRCFFAVRVATALQLRLDRTPAGPHEAATDREDLMERADPPEAEDRDRGYDERDRDRETERASLPILLRTLEGVAADAETLPGAEPAELLTLRELIAHAKAAPSPAQSLRSRRTGSGAAPAPPLRSPASNVAQVLAARRATGPPRR